MSKRFYMLVNKGLVQRLEVTQNEKPVKVWPIAETHADAMRLARWLNAPHLRPALVGSVSGETLEGHLAMAFDEGCVAICCVAGWEKDSSPRWKWKHF